MNTDLPAATARLAEARAQHAADAAALARGKERLASAEAEVQRLADEDVAAISRHARRLEESTRAGRNGPLPSLVPTDKHVAQQLAASRTLSAAQEMITSLTQAASCAAKELAEAEVVEREVRDALRRLEVDRIAARLAALRAEEQALCARLLVVDLDSPGVLTAQAAAALASPPGRPSVESLLGHGIVADVDSPLCGRADLLAAARQHWREFDEHLTDSPSERAA